MQTIELTNSYTCRYGAPTVSRVHPEIFGYRYFGKCMSCETCDDVCCQFGVDVDVENVSRIMSAFGESIQAWFGPRVNDLEFPGGGYHRTKTSDRGCLFLNPERGCSLHARCLEQGVDYHELKPMVSCLFPLTFDDGLLHASNEVCDTSLYCLCSRISLYRGVRDELAYYFSGLVDEIDVLEQMYQDAKVAQ